MRIKKISAGLLLVATITVLAGCTGDVSPLPSPTSEFTLPVETPSPTPVVVEGEVKTVEDANKTVQQFVSTVTIPDDAKIVQGNFNPDTGWGGVEFVATPEQNEAILTELKNSLDEFNVDFYDDVDSSYGFEDDKVAVIFSTRGDNTILEIFPKDSQTR